MGKLLFIRVSAATYDEKDVLRAWPKLYATVWPDAGANAADSPSRIVKKLIPDASRGVLELLDGFVEYVRFADAPARDDLKPYADTLEDLRAKLDEALGNRDAQKASALTNDIEDALDEAEEAEKAARG